MTRSPLSWALAPAVVAAVLLLQTRASLPAPGWRAAALALAALALLAACVARRHAPRSAASLVVAAIAALAWTLAAERAAQRLEARLPAALEGVELTVRGVVDELPSALQRGQRFGFRTEGCELAPAALGTAAAEPEPEVDAAPAAGPPRTSTACTVPPRLSLTWQSNLRRVEAVPPPLRAAQRWSLTVRLRRPHAPINPEAFDRELRWLQEGIGAVGTVRSGRLIDERVDEPALLRERLRGAVRTAIFEAAGPGREREAGVLAALAVGDQAAIECSMTKET